MNYSPVRWEEAIEQWESSEEDKNRIQSLYRYVVPMTKRRRKDQKMNRKIEQQKESHDHDDGRREGG